MRYTAGDKPTAVLGFSVAVTSGYGDNAKTTWANCQLFGKRAESLAPYVVKGATVAVSGEVTLREWESNGKKGQSLQVSVNDLTLCGGKSERGASDNSPLTPSQTGLVNKSSNPSDFSDMSDDVPFMNPYKFNWRLV